MEVLESEGLDIFGIQRRPMNVEPGHHGLKTAQYVAINDSNKDLVVAMADMDLFGTARLEEYTATAKRGKHLKCMSFYLSSCYIL